MTDFDVEKDLIEAKSHQYPGHIIIILPNKATAYHAGTRSFRGCFNEGGSPALANIDMCLEPSKAMLKDASAINVDCQVRKIKESIRIQLCRVPTEP